MDYANSLENISLSVSRKKNLEVLKIIQLSSQELIKLKGNDEFFDNIDNATKIIEIISGDSQISIRLIDHFITKYSKYNKCSYKLTENNKDLIFNIYIDYKNQLKHYQKIHFDPFSRGDRIPFFMKDTCIITTIGQLNFFKWFISKKIYDYLLGMKDIVFDDMNKKIKVIKQNTNILNKKMKYKNKNDPPKKMIVSSENNEKKSTSISVSFEL